MLKSKKKPNHLLKVCLLRESSHRPVRKLNGLLDFYSSKDMEICPGETLAVPLGISMEPPENHWVQLLDRSSVAKSQVFISGGVIDCDYRGEVFAVLTNFSGKCFKIQQGDRVCQGSVRFEPPCKVKVVPEQCLRATPRGQAGFGSTGK